MAFDGSDSWYWFVQLTQWCPHMAIEEMRRYKRTGDGGSNPSGRCNCGRFSPGVVPRMYALDMPSIEMS